MISSAMRILGIAASVILALALQTNVPVNAEGRGCHVDSPWCTQQSEISVRMRDVSYIAVPRPDPREYRYTQECLSEFFNASPLRCTEEGMLPRRWDVCPVGSMTLPRWSRPRGASDSSWTLDAFFTCPGEVDYPITFDDFARLPIDPSPARIQPDQSWVYAGLETIAHTSGQPQGFTVELRGQVYNVGAIPQEFVWDFGDGSASVTTTDPGAPWPDHTVSHVYTATGTARPTLTTRWSGVFQIDGLGDWHEIPGTAETVSTGPELRVHAPRPRLVDAPVG